jgi:hypothetical protein
VSLLFLSLSLNPKQQEVAMTTEELLKKIRLHRTSAGGQAWIEQAAAWRLTQEQAISKADDKKSAPPKPKTTGGFNA